MIKNYFELVDINNIEFTNEYNNMVDISIDNDESFLLSNGIVSHNSAAATAKRGFSVTGTDYYGLYPLKGKPLNVRDLTLNSVRENVEISSIISALGLEFGKKYNSTRTLRYGKLVIMSDADCIDENTLVLTKRGYIAIKDVNYDDMVLTHTNKWKKIHNIIKTNKENVIKLIINGEKYIFGENHEIPILRNGEILLVYAKNILSTDKVLKKKQN